MVKITWVIFMIIVITLLTIYFLYYIIYFTKENKRQKRLHSLSESFEDNGLDNEFIDEEIYNKAIHTKGYVSYEESGFIDRKKWYKDVYLKSPHWQKLRKIVLENADYKCQVCGESKPLDIHHNTYGNLGHEKISDLIALCKHCHKLYHDAN